MLIVSDSRVIPSADWEWLLRELWWYQKVGFKKISGDQVLA